MAELKRVGDLEIAEDMRYQGRAWRVQRIGWGVMLLIVVAGLAGLFGTGPLSSATAGQPGENVQLEYNRFWRQQYSADLKLRLRPPAAARTARVWISRQYLDDVQIDWITPQVLRAETTHDRTWFVFALAPGHTGEIMVDFHVRPEVTGTMHGTIGLESGETLSFWQFIYP